MRFLPRSRQARRWIAIGAVGATVAGAASVAWASSRDDGDTSDVPSTLTATASLQTFEETVVTTGTFQPAVTAELTFPVEGDIESVNVAEGDTVVEGDVLATVGTESLEAELAAAESNLDAALEQLESDQDNDASDAQLAASEAAVTAAESQLTAAEEALDGAQLRATVDGTVAEVNIAAGDHVSGSGTSGGVGDAGGTNTTTTTTSAHVVIISTDRFVVETSVSTADVGRLATGLQAEMTPSDTNDTVFGTVSSVGLVAESTDGGVATFPVEIEVTGEVEGVYVGGSATVTIIVSQRSDVLAVPAAALTTTDGQTTATVVRDGQQIDIPVEVGESFGDQTEIVSGISEGDEVVINLAVPGGDQDDNGDGQDGPPGSPGGGGGFPGGDGFQGGGGGGFPGGGFPGGQE